MSSHQDAKPGHHEVVVCTGTRGVILRRGSYRLEADGREVHPPIPEFGQVVAWVRTEADVLNALTAVGYRVGAPVEAYARDGARTRPLTGVLSAAVAEFLGLNPI